MAHPKFPVHTLLDKDGPPPRKWENGFSIWEPSENQPTTQRQSKCVSEKEKESKK